MTGKTIGVKMSINLVRVIIIMWFGCVMGDILERGGRKWDLSLVTPRYISTGQTYRAVIGDTLELPCEVEGLGPYVLLWRRGSSVLTADTIMVTRDARFKIVGQYNLQIQKVMPQDAGDYVCQIGDGELNDQTHTVEILVPPSIRIFPSNGKLTTRKGSTISLECKASGNPVPKIYWSRKDKPLPTGEKTMDGFSLTLDKVDRHHAGTYRCNANNGVGEPVSMDMQLDVLYPPEIEVERSWVHTGEGYEAQLECIVHGQPTPQIQWYQDSFILNPMDRHYMTNNANKHILTISSVTVNDFGNYSCVAENSLGKAKKYMELSGRPSPAKFRSTPYSRAKDSYNLTWAIESYPALTEVRLLYRKIIVNDTVSHPGKWHDIILKPHSDGKFTHVMSYTIRGLEPASAFEAIIQARNTYGWNEVSDMYQFFTKGSGSDLYDYPSEPKLEDIELNASTSRAGYCTDLSTHLLISVLAVQIYCTRNHNDQ